MNELTHAVMSDNANRIHRVLTRGSDLHENDDEALYAAVFHGHLNATRALLSAGASVAARDYEIVQLAVENRHKAILTLILRFMSQEQKDEAVICLRNNEVKEELITKSGLIKVKSNRMGGYVFG